MRQVQYLTQLLQQILFKKKQRQFEEAIEQIQKAFQELLKNILSRLAIYAYLKH